MKEALLEVNGEDLILAQMGAGLVTDTAPSEHLLPLEIECPHCQRRYSREAAYLRETI